MIDDSTDRKPDPHEVPTAEIPAPSASRKSRRTALPSSAARKTLGALEPFSYRNDRGEPRLGVHFRGVPQTDLARGERYAPMDLLIVLTRVVQEQEREIASLRSLLTDSGKS